MWSDLVENVRSASLTVEFLCDIAVMLHPSGPGVGGLTPYQREDLLFAGFFLCLWEMGYYGSIAAREWLLQPNVEHAGQGDFVLYCDNHIFVVEVKDAESASYSNGGTRLTRRNARHRKRNEMRDQASKYLASFKLIYDPPPEQPVRGVTIDGREVRCGDVGVCPRKWDRVGFLYWDRALEIVTRSLDSAINFYAQCLQQMTVAK